MQKTEREGGWDGLVPGYQLWRGKSPLPITVKCLRPACKHANTFTASAFHLERRGRAWMLFCLKPLLQEHNGPERRVQVAGTRAQQGGTYSGGGRMKISSRAARSYIETYYLQPKATPVSFIPSLTHLQTTQDLTGPFLSDCTLYVDCK